MENVPVEIQHLTLLLIFMCAGAGVKVNDIMQAESSDGVAWHVARLVIKIVMIAMTTALLLSLVDKALPCLIEENTLQINTTADEQEDPNP